MSEELEYGRVRSHTATDAKVLKGTIADSQREDATAAASPEGIVSCAGTDCRSRGEISIRRRLSIDRHKIGLWSLTVRIKVTLSN